VAPRQTRLHARVLNSSSIPLCICLTLVRSKVIQSKFSHHYLRNWRTSISVRPYIRDPSARRTIRDSNGHRIHTPLDRVSRASPTGRLAYFEARILLTRCRVFVRRRGAARRGCPESMGSVSSADDSPWDGSTAAARGGCSVIWKHILNANSRLVDDGLATDGQPMKGHRGSVGRSVDPTVCARPVVQRCID